MATIGTPLSNSATRVLLCGSGELGKEVAIEAVAIPCVNKPIISSSGKGQSTILSEEDLSEFALHARAIPGLPIPNIHQHGPSASSVLLAEGESDQVSFSQVDAALHEPHTQVRLFGKPEVRGRRRMGVVLARAEEVEEAWEKANRAAEAIVVYNCGSHLTATPTHLILNFGTADFGAARAPARC